MKDLLSYGITNISLLDKACLHHISVPVQSYFLILALHKLEWEQKKTKQTKNQTRQGVVRRECLPPKFWKFCSCMNSARWPTPLFLDCFCSHFSLNVARMHKLFLQECLLQCQARHSGSSWVGKIAPLFLLWYSITVQDLVHLAHILSCHIII